jgi:hypothetical protein
MKALERPFVSLCDIALLVRQAGQGIRRSRLRERAGCNSLCSVAAFPETKLLFRYMKQDSDTPMESPMRNLRGRRVISPLPPHCCFVLRYARRLCGFGLREPHGKHMIRQRKGDSSNAEVDEARGIEAWSNGVGSGGFAQVG